MNSASTGTAFSNSSENSFKALLIIALSGVAVIFRFNSLFTLSALAVKLLLPTIRL